LARGTQKESKSELGILVSDLTPEISQQLNLGGETGVVVTGIEPGTKAEDSGIIEGDLIKEINHKEIKNLLEYKAAIKAVKSGEPIQMFIRRADGFVVVKIDK
jgi:serine protease Do